jgi:transcriptional regulator with XRE-family HTH domain
VSSIVGRRDRYREQAAALADALKKTRKLRDLSQQQLAERALLSIGTIRNFEQTVVTNPGLFEIAAIAGAMNVSVDELLAPPAAGHDR